VAFNFMANRQDPQPRQKMVLLPDLERAVPWADACPADAFAAFRAEHPDHLVVSYIQLARRR